MCSEGVSVWFACKLCKSFFLNADDFAYHKKKSHVEEFRSTKFIVFEEQTTPPASSPKNWVSFLSPKEETLIHRIILPPSPPTTTNVDPGSRSIQTNRSKKLIEITSENNSHSNDCDDADEVTNSGLELISVFKSISNTENAVEILENDSLQNDIEPTMMVHNTTEEKRDKLLSAIIESAQKCKTRSLKRSQGAIPNVLSKKARKIVPHVNRTIHLNENDTLNKNPVSSNENRTNEYDVEVSTAATDQELFHQMSTSDSTARSPPLTISLPCKFCTKNFSSTAELDDHEEICRLKTQFENIFCPPCCLTFGSSDELNEHNRTLHSTSFSTPESDATKAHTEFANEGKVSPKIKIEPEVSRNCEANSNNDNQQDLISNHISSTEVNFIYDHVLGAVKTEYTDENEESEFPAMDQDQDPFQSETNMELSAQETKQNSVAASSSSSNNANSDETQEKLSCQTDISRYCISCETHFPSLQELINHNRNYHGTLEGKGHFPCPHLTCGTATRDQYLLRVHLLQVHSSARLFKCSQPNCDKSFKTSSARNRHFRCHTSPM